MRRWLAVVALAGASCASSGEPLESPQQRQLARAVSPPRRQNEPAYLPEETRALVRQRMVEHARNMGVLTQEIMVLDYPSIASHAGEIAKAELVPRPGPGDEGDPRAKLPATFFDLEDELRARAADVATAAEHQKAIEVATAYGKLSETCVRCHDVYRSGGK